MLLNHLNLAVAKLASKDETRLSLGTLHVTPEHTEATDGHCLGRVTMPLQDSESFPPCGGVVGTSEKLTPCLIPADDALALAKAIPPIKVTRRLPALGYARVDVAASNANGHFRAVTTDGESVRVLEPRKVELEFPDVSQIMPKTEPVLTVGFNAHLLASVLKVASEFNERTHAVKLEFFGSLNPKDKNGPDVNPVQITATCVETGQTGTFLVMPMRL